MDRRRGYGLVALFLLLAAVGLFIYYDRQVTETSTTTAVAPAAPESAPADTAAAPETAGTGAPAPADGAPAAETDIAAVDAGAETAPAAGTAAVPAGAEDADAAPPSAPGVPTFDIVRVEPSGETVIAGQAEPHATVEIVDTGTVIASGNAGETGDWAIALEKPLPPGTHDLAIQTTSQDESVVMLSDQRVTVSVPEDGSDVLVVLNAPGAPSTVLQVPPGTEVAGAAPATVEPDAAAPGPVAAAEGIAGAAAGGAAPAEQTVAAAPEGTVTPDAAPAADTTQVPATETAAATPQPDAPSAPAADSAPTDVATATDAASATGGATAAPATGDVATAATAAPAAPSGDAASSGGSAVATTTETEGTVAPATPGTAAVAAAPATDAGAKPAAAAAETAAAAPGASTTTEPAGTEVAAAPPAAAEPAPAPPPPEPLVIVTAVEADVSGTLYIAGTATTPEAVRVYLDDKLVGEAVPAPSGVWLVETEADLPAGQYTVRVDQVKGDGTVIARSEVPFDREVEVAILKPTGTMPAGGGATMSGTAPEVETVIIKKGDNLWRIARAAWGKGIRWSTIYAANGEQIRNPHWIYPGQVFVMPKGDTAWEN